MYADWITDLDANYPLTLKEAIVINGWLEFINFVLFEFNTVIF